MSEVFGLEFSLSQVETDKSQKRTAYMEARKREKAQFIEATRNRLKKSSSSILSHEDNE